jgi:putative DNA primase/helicase
LWIVRSYLHDAIDILPILTITSPDQECGKTTLLKVVFNLCNRPVSASNISAAAIYRIIGEDCPCLTLDEADSYMQEDEAMRGIINSGHERQMAFVLRVINDKGDVGRFPTWCPKAIAMIGLPRRTILSRSIHIRIERKDKGTKLEKLRRKHYAELEDLRRKISKLANDIRARVKAFESDDQLGNRAGDNWEPLFAIASAADEEWLAEAVAAAERMSGKDAHDAKTSTNTSWNRSAESSRQSARRNSSSRTQDSFYGRRTY